MDTSKTNQKIDDRNWASVKLSSKIHLKALQIIIDFTNIWMQAYIKVIAFLLHIYWLIHTFSIVFNILASQFYQNKIELGCKLFTVKFLTVQCNKKFCL